MGRLMYQSRCSLCTTHFQPDRANGDCNSKCRQQQAPSAFLGYLEDLYSHFHVSHLNIAIESSWLGDRLLDSILWIYGELWTNLIYSSPTFLKYCCLGKKILQIKTKKSGFLAQAQNSNYVEGWGREKTGEFKASQDPVQKETATRGLGV